MHNEPLLLTRNHKLHYSFTVVNRDLRTCVGHVSRSHYPPDLLHSLKVGREAAVAAEYLLVNYRGDGEAVKAIRERFPELYVVSAFALIVETCWDKVPGFITLP